MTEGGPESHGADGTAFLSIAPDRAVPGAHISPSCLLFTRFLL